MGLWGRGGIGCVAINTLALSVLKIRAIILFVSKAKIALLKPTKQPLNTLIYIMHSITVAQGNSSRPLYTEDGVLSEGGGDVIIIYWWI